MYTELQKVLDKALERASRGKGAARHATDQPFHKQPIVTEQHLLGPQAALYQIRKKALESLRLPPTQAQKELLDIINYAAACFIYYDQTKEEDAPDASK